MNQSVGRYRDVFKKQIMENTVTTQCIYRKIEGKLSVTEEKYFDSWLNESEKHREYFEKMRELYLKEGEQAVLPEEVQAAWVMFMQRMEKNKRVGSRHYWLWGMGTAASVLLVWCCYMFLFSGKDVPQKMDTLSDVIVPGQHGAILEMADGKVYHLGESSYSFQEKTGNQIIIDSVRLSYLPTQHTILPLEEMVYHKLSVPRGGEYRIELEDGTKVWINSASRLRYPVVFTGDRREVFLEGEAYFEVRRDTSRPFVVHAGTQRITVLGTSFGITCYPSEENDYTTLVSGCVKVEFEQMKQGYVLIPGMQVAYNKKSGEVVEKIVEVEEFVAWKEGKYVFNQKRLEDILSTLSRWYDFEIIYRDQGVKDIVFSGELKRFDDFDYLLQLIERTSGVKFIIDKKVVQVMR